MTSPIKHTLILGCGRSGTSIFGEFFDHLPEYSYYSEPDFAEYRQLDFSKPVAAKVPRDNKDFPGPHGLSFPPDALPEAFLENGLIFWQVRHPLDAICSLRIGIARNWGHHPRPHDWQEWLERPLLERCAHHWAHLNSDGYQHVAKQAVVCRFEDMIRDPMQFAQSIAGQTGLDLQKNGDQIREWATRVQDTNNEKFVEAHTSRPYSRPDHSKRVGRWQENLTGPEVGMVLPIIADAAMTFDYQLP